MLPNGPTTPRPSASLIVVNAKNEVLLVHRNPKATSFSGMHVFPGGNYDAKQDKSFQFTAIRETFEETGLLLASSRREGASPIPLPDETLDSARAAVHSNTLSLLKFLENHELKPDVELLLPLTQWITPENALRRFHTHFFIAFLPAAPSTGFSSGHVRYRLPTPDGGQEVVEARFIHPAAALAKFSAGCILLMPPQYYLLTTLASILQGGSASATQHAQVEALATGAFGRMVVNPRPWSGSDVPNGYTCLTYEGDETRGGPAGQLHRSVLRLTNGVPTEIALYRNFDIFTKIPDSPQSKL
ncbi:NUDIX hydrolase domain-like protein [Vararia minispora EC-137]|uniref:NUDIX hydrolase domain-like protein n=1 Tax=Vararia minispora EC-137 TaxID=1314806 RepID=A0ACB8QMD5_9AGAM|nr:NUDIX hydrolase domain-like protein [Vararia minispora EC-137]